MKHLTSILLALFATCAHAGDTWQEPENQWAIAALGAETFDWGQTRTIAKTHRDELNPIMGKHPSIARVNTYFAGVTVASYLIADALPHPYRKAFLQAATMIEVGYVAHNFKLGIRTSF